MIKNSMEAFENEVSKNDFSIIKFTTFQNGFSISDNGSGIAPKIADKLFTPFFSTKTTGQGVGLTLIREILLNHKTIFSLKNGDDGWTVFEVVF
jgi:nitrogen-specific signal transduction histidine kinase